MKKYELSTINYSRVFESELRYYFTGREEEMKVFEHELAKLLDPDPGDPVTQQGSLIL